MKVEGYGRGALLGGFAIGSRVSLLYDNIASNAKCQRVLVLALRLVIIIVHTPLLIPTPLL